MQVDSFQDMRPVLEIYLLLFASNRFYVMGIGIQIVQSFRPSGTRVSTEFVELAIEIVIPLSN